MLKRFVAMAIAAFGGLATVLMLALPAGASIIGDPGIYLNSTHTLALAAPNVIVAGKSAVLKPCNNGGDCRSFETLKASEQWSVVRPSADVTDGGEIQLTGTNWCLTQWKVNGVPSVVFETCNNWPAQRWHNPTSNDVNVSPAPITNVKTGLNIDHTAVVAYAKVAASQQNTFWGITSNM